MYLKVNNCITYVVNKEYSRSLNTDVPRTMTSETLKLLWILKSKHHSKEAESLIRSQGAKERLILVNDFIKLNVPQLRDFSPLKTQTEGR